MDWIAILELLLPILLELLKNSPEEQAFAKLRNPDRWTRLRLKTALRGQLDNMVDAAVAELAKMSDDEIKELIAASKAV